MKREKQTIEFKQSWRDEYLAGVFFKCGLIEAWGRGFDKITAGCKEYGGSLPDYKISESGVMVLCKACPAYMALQGNAGEMAGQSGKNEDDETGLKTGLKTRDRIVALLKEHPSATIAEIVECVGLSRNGVKWNIDRLKEDGQIRRVGPDKGGRWEVLSG